MMNSLRLWDGGWHSLLNSYIWVITSETAHMHSAWFPIIKNTRDSVNLSCEKLSNFQIHTMVCGRVTEKEWAKYVYTGWTDSHILCSSFVSCRLILYGTSLVLTMCGFTQNHISKRACQKCKTLCLEKVECWIEVSACYMLFCFITWAINF